VALLLAGVTVLFATIALGPLDISPSLKESLLILLLRGLRLGGPLMLAGATSVAVSALLELVKR